MNPQHETRIHVLRQESHMWPEPANTFLLEDESGAILIDAGCGWPESYERIRSFLESHGYQPADVHTVVLSHAHPDHMGAMPFLLEECEPRVYLHELEVELARDPRLLNRSFDMCHIKTYMGESLGDDDAGEVELLEYFSGLCPMGAAAATDTMADGDVLSLGELELEVVHTPGHAPGHVSLYERDRGLLLTFDVIGEVVAWYCPSGGGAKGYLDSLDRLEGLGARLILPSHGEDIEDVAGAIERTREVIMARERRILEMLGGGKRTMLELVEDLFPSPGMRLFPGLQITDSHLQKLEEDGLVTRLEPGDVFEQAGGVP